MMNKFLAGKMGQTFVGDNLALWIEMSAELFTRTYPELDRFDRLVGGDGDTGTNAMLTWDAVRRAVANLPRGADLEWVANTAAEAGARESYGMIGLAQVAFLDAVAANVHYGKYLRPLDLWEVFPQTLDKIRRIFHRPNPNGVERLLQSVVTETNLDYYVICHQIVMNQVIVQTRSVETESGPDYPFQADPGVAAFALIFETLTLVANQLAQPEPSQLPCSILSQKLLDENSHIPEILKAAVAEVAEEVHFWMPKPSFEVSFAVELAEDARTRISKPLEAEGADFALQVTTDPFGLKSHVLEARLDTLAAALPRLERPLGAVVTSPTARQLEEAEDTLFALPQGVELLQSKSTEPVPPRICPVVAVQSNQWLAAGMALAGVRVVFHLGQDPLPIAKAIATCNEDSVLVLTSDDESTWLARSAVRQLRARSRAGAQTPPDLVVSQVNSRVMVAAVAAAAAVMLPPNSPPEIAGAAARLEQAQKNIHWASLDAAASEDEIIGTMATLRQGTFRRRLQVSFPVEDEIPTELVARLRSAYRRLNGFITELEEHRFSRLLSHQQETPDPFSSSTPFVMVPDPHCTELVFVLEDES